MSAGLLCLPVIVAAQQQPRRQDNNNAEQQNDTLAYTTPSVVVSAARTTIDMDRVPRTVEVLTSADLARLPVRSVQEALAYLPGVDLRQRGPLGVQADLSMRGGTFEQSAVLFNGLRVNDIQTGHHSLNLPVLADEVDRIEVIKGGGSRLFGTGAMDGAVNIITKRGGPSRLFASATGGDFGLADGRLGASASTGIVDHRVSAQYLKTNGYMPSTDVDMQSVLYTGSISEGSTQASLTGGVVNKAFGANGYYSNRFPDQWEHTVTWFAGATARTDLSDVLSVNAQALYRINSDEFLLKRSDPAFYRNLHRTDQLTANVQTTLSTGIGRTTLALEGGSDRIESTNLGNFDRVRGSLSLEHAVSITDRLYAGAGVGTVFYSDRVPGIVGGVDVSYHIAPGSRVYATVNRNMRIPTYTDLYYKDPVTVGNPTLKPETSVTAELGTSLMVGDVILSGAAYNRSSNDLIDYVFRGDSLPWQAQNFTSVRVTGGELGVRWLVTKTLRESPLTLLRVSANAQDVSSQNDVRTRYVADNLRWQFILETQWTIPGIDVQASFLLRAQERVVDPKANVIGDARIWKQFDVVRVVAEASNLWNTTWIETGFVPMPSRWFRMGVEVTAPL